MISLILNGALRSLDVPEDFPLLWALRDILGMMGTKFGCGIAQCGACTVHVDGVAVRACITEVGSVAGSRITTIEAMADTPIGTALQSAWLELDVVQCGYCQAGQIMSAGALLAENPAPDDAAIDTAMAGNICRCATYQRIRAAIKLASRQPQADRRHQ
jgi:isoquinoline 1-oxidoreductase alpha subunit